MIVALLNQKGGVGKTTIALHLAGRWSREGKRVIVIDADPQAVRTRITQSVRPDDFARPDRAGGWIVPLGEERHIISGA